MNGASQRATLSYAFTESPALFLAIVSMGFSAPFENRINISETGEITIETTGMFPGGQEALNRIVEKERNKTTPYLYTFALCISTKNLNINTFFEKLSKSKFKINNKISNKDQMTLSLDYLGTQHEAIAEAQKAFELSFRREDARLS